MYRSGVKSATEVIEKRAQSDTADRLTLMSSNRKPQEIANVIQSGEHVSGSAKSVPKSGPSAQLKAGVVHGQYRHRGDKAPDSAVY
jgi:hypothetical protein